MPARRTIWILKDNRAGDLAQMRHLLRVLSQSDVGTDWIADEKQLLFQPGARPTPARTWKLLDPAASGLGPPWPHVLLATEKIATWIGAALKQKSVGASKLVVLGRMAGDPGPCDLVLATPQFAAPSRQTVMLPVPLAPAPTTTSQSRSLLREAMAGRPRPWTLWAIGGSVPPDRLDEASIDGLVQAVAAHANGDRGTALVFTSPRTGKGIANSLRTRLPPNGVLYEWNNGGQPNLFPAALAEVDRIVVTSDSISMAAEAIDCGKPVALYRLPQSNTLAPRLGHALVSGRCVPRLAGPLLRRGIIEIPPDRQAFFSTLIAQGWLADFPAFPAPTGEPPLRRAERLAVEAVRMLFA